MQKIFRRLSLFFINNIFKGLHFFAIKRALLRLAGIKTGVGVRVVGPIFFGTVSKISIGDGTFINRGFAIEGNGTLLIGNNCDFGPNVKVLTGTHEIGDSSRHAGNGICLQINIGDGCWIGANSTLLGNLQIGSGSVVGCCTLVNRDVQKNTLVAGLPAKKIKDL